MFQVICERRAEFEQQNANNNSSSSSPQLDTSIDDEKERKKSSVTTNDDEFNIYTGSKRRRVAFVDMLLATAMKDPSALDDHGIQEEVDTFMFEVHFLDTTDVFDI